MANAFQTLPALARDASIMLKNELVCGALFRGQVEQAFVDRNSGGSVRVTYTPKQTAQTVDHTSTSYGVDATNVSEFMVDVPALFFVAVKHKLTTKQLTYDVDTFAQKVTAPAMVGIAEAVDSRIALQVARGAGGITGTPGTAPSTVAHIVAARKSLKDRGVPMAGLVGVLGTTAEASYLQIDQFTNRNYGEDGATALRAAKLSTRYGVNWFATQSAGGTIDEGDTAGTTLVDGAASAGATSIVIDGFTNATGTIYAGAKFTIAGSTTEYTVVSDVAKASNEGTFSILPALSANAADNAAVTFAGDFTADFIAQPGGVVAAVVAPAPLAVNSSVVMVDGMSVRVTVESTTGTSSVDSGDTIEYATYVAAKVVRPESVEIMQG